MDFVTLEPEPGKIHPATCKFILSIPWEILQLSTLYNPGGLLSYENETLPISRIQALI